MDVAIAPDVIRRRKIRRGAYALTALVVVGVASVALARMEPAAPTVERGTLWIDTVKRGPMVRQVRGLGTLVPDDTRWLPATTDGRVERILLRPGARVTPDSVILELSSPQVEQEALNARLALQSTEAALVNLRVQLQNELLTQRSVVAQVRAEYTQAQLEADANATLVQQKLLGTLILKQSMSKAEALKTRFEIEEQRLAGAQESIEARTQVQQAAIDQAKAILELRTARMAALKVRPGFSGVLQQVPVEVGQQVAPGQNLARVADPTRLKAQLRISETQAKDVELGQRAEVDTRNGVIAGVVSRKDPAAVNGTVTVDVTLTGELPRGAVPDLSVDGTVELERLDDALTVGRPAFGQEQSTVSLFRVAPDGDARRLQVKLGRSSVNTIEVLSGLNAGDQVVLSDMSAWDATDRVRIR
ncbi:MAG: HlyD family efflux transporter periplasmic adaptor subunit [Vicinamibacterales bacterium]